MYCSLDLGRQRWGNILCFLCYGLDVLHEADICKAENACVDFSLGMNVNRKLS